MTGGSSGMRSRLSPDISVEGEHEHRLETRIQELPPLRDGALRYEKRIGRPTKLVVTGLLVLLVSATLEFAFGIQV